MFTAPSHARDHAPRPALLPRQADAFHQPLVSGLVAQTGEARIELQIAHRTRALLDRALEPRQRAVVVVEPCADECSEECDVGGVGLARELTQELALLGLSPGYRVQVAERTLD